MKFNFRKRDAGPADPAGDTDPADHTANTAEPTRVVGERDFASVNKKQLGLQAKLTALAIVLLIGGICAIMVQKYYAHWLEKRAARAQSVQKDARAVVTNVPPLLIPDLTDAPPPAMVANPVGAPPAMTAGTPGANGQPNQPIPLTPAQERLARRLGSPVMGGGLAGGAVGNALAGGNALVAQSGGTALGDDSAFAGMAGAQSAQDEPSPPATSARVTVKAGGIKARLLPDPSYWVTRGTVIRCTVLEAIDTTLPGEVTCIQGADVRGSDKKLVLLERNTIWTGRQEAGVAKGMRRVGMIWTRGETPNHVLVDTGNGAADELGRPGINGDVNNHFWARFGPAMLVSLVGDVGSYLAATQSKDGGNNTIVFPGTIQGGQSAMTDILKETMSIPPTLTRNQGAEVSIIVREDMDFRDVYGVRLSGQQGLAAGRNP